MDDQRLKELLDRLPVSWWETDERGRVVRAGGGAFPDPATAQRFLGSLAPPGATTDPAPPPRPGRPPAGDAARGPERGGPDPGRSGRDGPERDGPEPARAGQGGPDQGGPERGGPPGAWRQARFDGRLFDVSWDDSPPDGSGHRHGFAVETDGSHPAGPGGRQTAFADFADLAPAAAFLRDADGRYLWANHAYAHLYGTTPDRITGRRIEEFDQPHDAERFRALDQEILRHGRPVRHTLQFRRPDGTTGRAAGHRFPARDFGVPCVAGIYVDVTDHARAMDQRREAEENLRALRDHSGLPCALLTADGRVLQASTAVTELLGCRLSALVGRRADSMLAPGTDLAGLHDRWRGLISRRHRRTETSVLLVDAKGRQRRTRVHLTTVGTNGSRAEHVWAVVTHQGLAHEAHPPLTPAQTRILSMLAEGRSNADIGALLRLSRQTVDYHLSRLRELLGAPTRPALVARAYVLGILAPQAWPPRSATATHPLSTT